MTQVCGGIGRIQTQSQEPCITSKDKTQQGHTTGAGCSSAYALDVELVKSHRVSEHIDVPGHARCCRRHVRYDLCNTSNGDILHPSSGSSDVLLLHSTPWTCLGLPRYLWQRNCVLPE
jgi:hypothetical protein